MNGLKRKILLLVFIVNVLFLLFLHGNTNLITPTVTLSIFSHCNGPIGLSIFLPALFLNRITQHAITRNNFC